MIADLPPPPVATSEAARDDATYGIAARGRPGELVNLQQKVESQGWKTRWMVVGGTTMLLVVVLPSTLPEDVTKLLNAINNKELGDLTAGLARVGGGR